MPDIQNFTIPAGDDVVLEFSIADEAASSLAGATVRWWAARTSRVPIESVPIKKETGSGIEITSAEDREFAVTIDGADTEALRGDYYHEAEVTDAQGTVSTVTRGRMTVLRTLIREP